MSGAARNGSKLVGAAVVATLGALGVGTVYLPFIADKDRVRGLHEESDLSPAEQMEYERVMREMQMQQQRAGTADGSGGGGTNGNSMWKRMDQAVKQQK